MVAFLTWELRWRSEPDGLKYILKWTVWGSVWFVSNNMILTQQTFCLYTRLNI
uniref:Uncharacterized protein n=1 Tax=Anguilla anguilla TaxID=7936 RepID=A0A0E9PG32_ANGAN